MDHWGILYFSSTGNSLYLAKKLREKLGGEIRYIPTYKGNGSEFDRIAIVTPIYSFGLPVPVFDLLPRLNKDRPLNVIQTYGGMVGGADRLFYAYATAAQLPVVSMDTVKMPENFTLVMAPPAFYKNRLLKSADRRIEAIAEAIVQQRCRLPSRKKTKEKTYLKNKSNWYKIGQRFSVNERCTGCGACVTRCPAHNLTLTNGKVQFGDHCIACLGCFHRCPHQAVVYRNKDNKKRYLHPLIDESEIGKDL